MLTCCNCVLGYVWSPNLKDTAKLITCLNKAARLLVKINMLTFIAVKHFNALKKQTNKSVSSLTIKSDNMI